MNVQCMGEIMKHNKRPSVNYIRKFLPSLRRVSTLEGRKWTIDGKEHFGTLQEVIEFYGKRPPELAELMKKLPAETETESILADILNAGAEKEVSNVPAN